jgi:hypothetical protein
MGGGSGVKVVGGHVSSGETAHVPGMYSSALPRRPPIHHALFCLVTVLVAACRLCVVAIRSYPFMGLSLQSAVPPFCGSLWAAPHCSCFFQLPILSITHSAAALPLQGFLCVVSVCAVVGQISTDDRVWSILFSGADCSMCRILSCLSISATVLMCKEPKRTIYLFKKK